MPDSYVDRGSLDDQLAELLERGKVHIALRGASKCGKSWLRRKILKDPIVVQCRLGRKAIDLYTDALSQLGIEFRSESTSSKQFKGTVKATGDAGFKLLAKVGLEASADAEVGADHKRAPVGRDINDLGYVAEIIKESGRKFGRGLVLSYNPDKGISVVDRQLLLYRKFATVNWPWESIITQVEPTDAYQADDSSELLHSAKDWRCIHSDIRYARDFDDWSPSPPSGH